jgi:hypothetical protein
MGGQQDVCRESLWNLIGAASRDGFCGPAMGGVHRSTFPCRPYRLDFASVVSDLRDRETLEAWSRVFESSEFSDSAEIITQRNLYRVVGTELAINCRREMTG